MSFPRQSSGSPLHRAGAVLLLIAGIAATLLAVLAWTDTWVDPRWILGIVGFLIPSALDWVLDPDVFFAVTTVFGVLTIVASALMLVRGGVRAFLLTLGVLGSAYFIFALIYILTNVEYGSASAELYVAPVVSLLLWLAGTISLMLSGNRGTSWR